MKTYNRFVSFSKRLLYHKSYLVMLLCILALTVTYKFLPEKSKTTDIRVAICFEEKSKYSEELTRELTKKNSVYNFIIADNKDELINSVKKTEVECGYYFTKDFFTNYINGIKDTSPVEIYVVPSTILCSSIKETVFSSIMKVSANDILLNSVNDESLNQELSDRLEHYLNGEQIFTLSTPITNQYNPEEIIYKVNIPVYEVTVLFIIFSSLLGLLLFQQDIEGNMFTAIPKKEKRGIRLTSITSAVLPILITGCLCIYIQYGAFDKIMNCIILAVISIIASYILGCFIKKSSSLSKILPLTALLSTIAVFISTLT